MRCPECGREIAAGADTCADCGGLLGRSLRADDALPSTLEVNVSPLVESDLPTIEDHKSFLSHSAGVKLALPNVAPSTMDVHVGAVQAGVTATAEGDAYTVLSTFGSEQGQEGHPFQPFLVELKLDGGIYVFDLLEGNDTRLQEFDQQGRFVRVVRRFTLGSSNESLDGPTDITLDGDGCIYVLDANNHRVQKFDSDGNWRSTLGAEGTAEGKLYFPKGLVCDRSGNIYIADTSNHRIQKWDGEGHCLLIVGCNERDEDSDEYIESDVEGAFDSPQSVAVDASGAIFVADTLNHRIQQFDDQGRYSRAFGVAGKSPGQLHFPISVQTNPEGGLFVVDLNGNRVQKFTRSGEPVSNVTLSAVEAGAVIDDIVVDNLENMIVAMRQSHQIVKIRRETA